MKDDITPVLKGASDDLKSAVSWVEAAIRQRETALASQDAAARANVREAVKCAEHSIARIKALAWAEA